MVCGKIVFPSFLSARRRDKGNIWICLSLSRRAKKMEILKFVSHAKLAVACVF